MNFTSFTRLSRIIINNLKNQTFRHTTYNKDTTFKCLQQTVINGKRYYQSFPPTSTLNPIGLVLGFSFLKSSEDGDDKPENKLIMTIKRSILSIQRKEYDKAEQMLHLALRMAQDLRNRDGVTYVYDVLANLAMERGQFEKAEKLFTDVMKRLFADGESEESIKENLDKAAQGFRWTMEKIDQQIQKLPDSKDLKELKAITSDWYGQMLIDQHKYAEAKKCFQEAFDVFIAHYGETYSELVPILNNLSVAALGLNDITSAKEYINRALQVLKNIPDAPNEGLLQANLGLIYLKEGLTEQAKTTCSYAYKLGSKVKDKDSINQAEYCLAEVKKAMQGGSY